LSRHDRLRYHSRAVRRKGIRQGVVRAPEGGALL